MSAMFTPQAFAEKWRASTLKESAAYQEHFNDLCRMLEHPTPAEKDPTGSFFTFQKGVTKEVPGSAKESTLFETSRGNTYCFSASLPFARLLVTLRQGLEDLHRLDADADYLADWAATGNITAPVAVHRDKDRGNARR